MKTTIIMASIALVVSMGCRKEEALPSTSQLDTEEPVMTGFDKWVADSLTKPYNIHVRYRWNDWNLTSLGKYNFPAEPARTEVLMRVMKHTWIDSYVITAGHDFVKINAPREFTIFGGVDRTANGGPGAWGQAAGGVNVLLFQTQDLDEDVYTSASSKKSFSYLMHHEYTHILNQNTPFDEAAFLKITPEGYEAQWQRFADWESQMVGFISSYARMNIMEDFAEMVSTLVTNSATEWDDLISDNYNFYSDLLNQRLGSTSQVTSRVAANRTAIGNLRAALGPLGVGLAALPATIESTELSTLQAYQALLAGFTVLFTADLRQLYLGTLDVAEAASVNSALNDTELPFRPGLLRPLVDALQQTGIEAIADANETLLNPARQQLDQAYDNMVNARNGRDKIKEKERFIAEYFERQLGVNLYALRDNVLRQIGKEVVAGTSQPAGQPVAALPSAMATAASGGLVPHQEITRMRMMEARKGCSRGTGVSYAW